MAGRKQAYVRCTTGKFKLLPALEKKKKRP